MQSLIIGLMTNNCAAERGVVFRVLNEMGPKNLCQKILFYDICF